jgi:hypothetical protein
MHTVTENVNALKALLEAPNTAESTVHVFIGTPTPPMDSDAKAHAYIALWPGVGNEDATAEDLQASPGVSTWTCQATCAGGDATRALRAVERLQATAIGKQLHPDSGFIRKVGDLGALRTDTSVTPNRQYAPIDLACET